MFTVCKRVQVWHCSRRQLFFHNSLVEHERRYRISSCHTGTQAPPRVKCLHLAAVLIGIAATLAPGVGVADDVYLRAGIGFDRPAETRFMDKDCSTVSPAALYGCGTGGDGAPLRSLGDFGTVAGVEFGVGYILTRATRVEVLVEYRPRFAFDGRANFLAPARQQSVSADLSSLSGMLAAYLDLPELGVPRLGRFSPFLGGGVGAVRVEIGETRMAFPKTTTIVPGARSGQPRLDADGGGRDISGRRPDARTRLALYGSRPGRDRGRQGPGRLAGREPRAAAARSRPDAGEVEEPRPPPVSALRVLRTDARLPGMHDEMAL